MHLPTPDPCEIAAAIRSDARACSAFIVSLSAWANWVFSPGTATIAWIGLAFMTAALWLFTHLLVTAPRWSPASSDQPVSADPWAAQRRMMEISGQEVPERPVLNKTGTLYGALILEEAAETAAALASALSSAARMSASDEQHELLLKMSQSFASAGRDMSFASKEVRMLLSRTSAFELRLAPADALELFDGTTDVTVVNCGFATALGLPGAAGYDEVQRSNLSKADPDTGLIEKDPGGKWIKGRDYFPPALDDVLQAEAYVRGRSEQPSMGL